jgi:MFS superfamily sulfate permease-like transporter
MILILGIAVSLFYNLESYGVKIVGEIPAGLPSPTLPTVMWSDINELLPLAFAVFLLASVETSAIGKMFPNKNGERFDPNKEFLSIGIANAAAGLGQGFPISGGTSQSLVNVHAKAQTLFSGAIAAIVIGIIIIFFTHWLSPLPQPILAAIILVAVTGLIKPAAIVHLYKVVVPNFSSLSLLSLELLLQDCCVEF